MRSTQRLTGKHGALLVVDLQDKLLASIAGRDLVVANTIGLIRAAKTLGLPVWGTEQYPRGLGPTVAAVAELISERPAKTTFHCCAVPQLLEQLYGRHVRHVTIAGIEAHVCVAQTALELLDLGFRVQIVGRRRRVAPSRGLGVRTSAPGTCRGDRLDDRSRHFRMDRDRRPARVQGDQRTDQVVESARGELSAISTKSSHFSHCGITLRSLNSCPLYRDRGARPSEPLTPRADGSWPQ